MFFVSDGLLRSALTLIEILVVIAVIGVLIGILLSALATARDSARRAKCLVNMRSLETANWTYMVESNGTMLTTKHSGTWFEELRRYNESMLLRSPVDTSPHFEGWVSIDGQYRKTIYALHLW